MLLETQPGFCLVYFSVASQHWFVSSEKRMGNVASSDVL